MPGGLLLWNELIPEGSEGVLLAIDNEWIGAEAKVVARGCWGRR